MIRLANECEMQQKIEEDEKNKKFRFKSLSYKQIAKGLIRKQ